MENILRGTRVYLAGPIEHASDAASWRNDARGILETMGVKCLVPTSKMIEGQEAEDAEVYATIKWLREEGDLERLHIIMKQIVERDCRVVDLADFVIVKLEPDVPTFGTIHELVLALQQHKPLFLCCDKLRLPFWIAGLVKPENIYNTMDELLIEVRKIDSGEIALNLKKWKLLAKELR